MSCSHIQKNKRKNLHLEQKSRIRDRISLFKHGEETDVSQESALPITFISLAFYVFWVLIRCFPQGLNSLILSHQIIFFYVSALNPVKSKSLRKYK